MSSELPYTITLPSGGVLRVVSLKREGFDTEEDIASSTLVANKRLCEGLTWRNSARELLGDPHAQFEYNEVGAPQIVGSQLNISVSHSSSLVAVLISPVRCAIDIESLDRNFERVAPRFISAEEQTLSSKAEILPLLWSIKETLYKYAGRKELRLLEDIKVIKVGDNSFEASLTPHTNTMMGVATILAGHSLVYIG